MMNFSVQEIELVKWFRELATEERVAIVSLTRVTNGHSLRRVLALGLIAAETATLPDVELIAIALVNRDEADNPVDGGPLRA